MRTPHAPTARDERRVPGRWRAGVPALPLALALSVAACGGQGPAAGGDAVDEVTPSDVAADLDAATYAAGDLTYEAALAGPVVAPEALPFTGLALGPADHALFEQATWVLRRPCLAAEGFEEPPLLSSASVAAGAGDAPDPARAARRYYHVAPEHAAEHGYAVDDAAGAAADARAQDDRAFDAMLAVMDERERDAFGAALSGCLREAEQELCVDGDLSEGDGYCRKSIELLSDLDATSYRVATESPAVEEAVDRWSRCMAEEGHHYRTVQEAWRAADDLPRRAAVDQAVADAGCKERARLVDVWATVEARVQEEMMAEEPDYFAGLAAERDALLDRARAVAAQGG
jgi:hypothetical protein